MGLSDFWSIGYQRGSLGKNHQNCKLLRRSNVRVVFPQESNLQPMDYRRVSQAFYSWVPFGQFKNSLVHPQNFLMFSCNKTRSLIPKLRLITKTFCLAFDDLTLRYAADLVLNLTVSSHIINLCRN